MVDARGRTPRIGVIVPAVNTVIEDWYGSVLAPQVGLATMRMPFGTAVTAAALREMEKFGIESARTLASARPDVILYGCTASTLIEGRAFDLALMGDLREATGVESLTTTECILRALAHTGARSIAVASPYTDVLGHEEITFFTECGYHVAGDAHLGVEGGFELGLVTADEIEAVAHRAWSAAGGAADTLLISCMNINSHLVVDRLEAALGVPVVTATQASLWAGLQEVGAGHVALAGCGRLLSRAAVRPSVRQ